MNDISSAKPRHKANQPTRIHASIWAREAVEPPKKFKSASQVTIASTIISRTNQAPSLSSTLHTITLRHGRQLVHPRHHDLCENIGVHSGRGERYAVTVILPGRLFVKFFAES